MIPSRTLLISLAKRVLDNFTAVEFNSTAIGAYARLICPNDKDNYIISNALH